MNATLRTLEPKILGIARIAIAFMFMQHGTAKLLGIPHVEMFDGLQILSMYGAAGLLELIGGALLLIGLFARPVAFVLSGMMAVAYFIGHAIPNGSVLVPFMNKGEPAALFSFIFLYFSVAGAGDFSLDKIRLAKKQA